MHEAVYFGGTVYLDDTIFTGLYSERFVYFNSARFEKSATFEKCEWFKGATFEDSRFIGPVSLATTKVQGRLNMSRVVFEDEEVMLLRGRFLLASRIGWAGGRDSVAVVPNVSRCQLAAEGGVASMEFRPAGRNTLSLVSREGPCRIVGLIIPPSTEPSGNGSSATEEGA